MEHLRHVEWVARAGLAVAAGYTLVSAFLPQHLLISVFHWDKAQHFAAFYVMTGLAVVAFPRTGLVGFGFALALFGALIEIVQGLPAVHRDLDYRDWIADCAGIVAVLGPILASKIRSQLNQTTAIR